MDMNDAALLRGIAARRAGATWEEMQAVVSLAFLFRGLSAANRGAELLANIAKRSELLYAVADEINRRFEEFPEAEVADTGKPHSLARHLDIPRGARTSRPSPML